MSRFMRQVVVAILVLSLLNLQSSASTISLPPAPLRYSLTAPLTEWASLASWHTGRFFRSLLRPQTGANLDTLRSATPNQPDPPNGSNSLPTTSYDDPKPTSTGYFNSYFTELTKAGNDAGVAGSKPLQSTDPTAGDCSVGGFSYNLDSRNYNFTAPALALGGRAGLSLALGLSYNSKVWTGYQVNTYNRQLAFNLDKGFPGPGWRIGFGAIQGVNNAGNIGPYTNSVTGKQSLIYLTPDGTRHDLAYNSTSGLYESYDSSYLDFNLTTKVLRTTSGMQVTFNEAATASGDYQFLPTQIKDRNGNFITIVYKTLINNDRVIDYVLDTLSRRIDFYYENNRLREIRQDRNGTIFKYAIIDYAPVTFNVSLQNQSYYDDDGNLLYTYATTPDPVSLNGTQVYLPIRITYPNGANLRFFYTSYAQMWLIEKWVPSITGQGAARRIGYTRFDLPSNSQASTPTNSLSNTLPVPSNVTDCPTLTRRVEQAENWNNGAEKTILYDYFLSDSSGNTFHAVTNGVENFRIYYTALTRALQTQDSSGNPLKTEKMTYTSDSGVSYTSNPRVTETKITDTQAGATRRTTISYTQQNGVWLPTTKDEYDQTTTTVYRRTDTTWTNYPAQRIIGLPLQLSIYAGAGTTLLARTTTSYDETGTFTDANNSPWNYLYTANGLTQHDDANYSGSFTLRGNPTSVTQSSVINGAITATRINGRTSWDSTGNVRGGVDGAGNPKGFGYGDNFINKPASVGQTGASVTIIQDAVGFITAANFDYYTGQVGTSYNVRPGSGVAEQLVTTTYDFADRPLQTTRPDGGWVKSGYWDNLLYATTFQKTDTINSTDQVGFSFKLGDGAGRILRQGSDHPNAIAGKYSGQKFVYDVNGRQSDVSNVTAINADWTPIDEDAATGWLFRNFVYDTMGKVKTFTDTDGTTIQKDYLGCGCAGGATVTTTDQRGCTVKSSTDFLGRLSQSSEYKTSDVALNGNYNNAVYTYDVLDHLTQIEVNDGGWTQAHKQFRTFTYDGYGRTVSETTPEAGTVNYTYTANDLLATKTDARGKAVTMTYNTRNLVTGMSYNDGGATPSASYDYDEFGARTSMTDGEGTMTYHYNGYRQLDYETRTFTGLASQSFTLNYMYNKVDQLTRVNYTNSAGWSKNINYARNFTGTMTGVGTNLIGTDPNATTNVVSGITYNSFSATRSLNYGNGRRLTASYNVNRHQMTSIVVDNQNGTDSIINKTYSFTSGTIDPNTGQPVNDNDGRIKKIIDSVDTSYTTTYSYDEFNRLTRAQATAYDRLYNYDRFGNLTQVSSSPGVVMQTLNLVQGTGGYPLNNRLANVNGNITYGYDASGNVTQEGSTTSTYDAANHLKEIGSGGQNVYGYDGDGMRVRKVESAAAPMFYVRSSKLGNVAMEVTQAQGIYRAYLYKDGAAIAQQSSDGNFYWVHLDKLGSGRKLTNTSGTVVSRAEFDPYGQALLESGSLTLNSRKFTGYERDSATGLDYANARMYGSTRGRFTQPDKLGLGAASSTIPESLNRYSYVRNDPVNFVDPSGMNLQAPDTGNNDVPTSCGIGFMCPGIHSSSSGDGEGGLRTTFWVVGGGTSSGGGTGGSGGGAPIPLSPKEKLKDRLNHLPQACIDAFGGPEKIAKWLSMLDSLEIVSSTSDYLLKPNAAGVQQTAADWFAGQERLKPNLVIIAATVSSSVPQDRGRFTDARYYSTIIIGPTFDKLSPIMQNAVLVHEFLHWESAFGNHVSLANLLNLNKRGYSYGTGSTGDEEASKALTDWLENDCKDK